MTRDAELERLRETIRTHNAIFNAFYDDAKQALFPCMSASKKDRDRVKNEALERIGSISKIAANGLPKHEQPSNNPSEAK